MSLFRFTSDIEERLGHKSLSSSAEDQMRISTTSASELLMLLNVSSGAFGASDVSAVEVKLEDYVLLAKQARTYIIRRKQ